MVAVPFLSSVMPLPQAAAILLPILCVMGLFAIQAYRGVVESGRRDDTAARCQFQIGECLFALKKHEQAIKELIRVEVNYASQQWRSRALLEIGRVLEAQDRFGKASERYREVMRKYGDLEAAAVARQLLEKISNKRGDP